MKRSTLGLLVLAGVGIPLAAAVGTAIAVRDIDEQALVNQLAQVVQKEKHRELLVKGPVKLSFFPRFGAVVSQLSLSEKDSEDTFVEVERASVSLAVLPLLKKQVVVDGIELKGLNVRVIKNEAGVFNFDDLLSEDKQTRSPVQFSIDKIELSNAQVLYNDQRSGNRFKVSNFDFKSGRIRENLRTDVSASGHLVASKPLVQADFNVRSGFEFGLGDAPRLALDKFALNVKAQLRGQPSQLDATVTHLEFDPAHAVAAVDDLRIDMQGQVGDGPVNASIRLKDITNTPAQVASNALTFKAHSKQGQRDVLLELNTPFSYAWSAKLLQFASMKGQLQLEDPALPTKKAVFPLDANAQFEVKKGAGRASLKSEFDQTHFNLLAGLQLSDEPGEFPHISLDVKADHLNVDRYIPPVDEKAKTADVPQDAKTAAAVDAVQVDLSDLVNLKLDGRLALDYFEFNHLKMSKVNAVLTSKGGLVNVSPMSAQMYEGTLNGSLEVNAAGNQAHLQTTLTGVQIEPLLKDLVHRDFAEGKTTMHLDVRSSGHTVGQMKKNLSGTASYLLKDGAIKGINLAKSARDIKARFTPGGSNEQVQASQVEKTDFSELSMSFQIQNGVGKSSDLDGKSPFIRLGGAGQVDLSGRTLDYVLRTTLVNTATGQGGKDLSQLRDLTVPVRMYGSFDKIQYEFLLSEMASQAAKNALMEKAQPKIDDTRAKLKDTVGQRLNEGLKGLLKKGQ